MFKKGDQVHFINSWNHKAQVTVCRLIVHSCGRKQMILVNEAGDKFKGCLFVPREEQGLFGRVIAGRTDAEAQAYAEKRCEEIRAAEIDRCENTVARVRACGQYGCDGYFASMERQIAELKADQAQVIWK